MFIEPKTVVWIAGASGRLGRAIEHKLDHSRYTIIPTDIEVDITDLTTVVQHADTYRPEIIINCAAMARKEDAEANPDLAYKVNALGARNLAIAATGSVATLVHLSTDDLFPGVIAHPINEFDKTLPPHIYGKSKEAGERLVLRTVFSPYYRTLKLGIYGQRRRSYRASSESVPARVKLSKCLRINTQAPRRSTHWPSSSSLRLNATNSARSMRPIRACAAVLNSRSTCAIWQAFLPRRLLAAKIPPRPIALSSITS